MELSFNGRMEAYYQKFIDLQEKLRKSEEERLKLEMKFNEMVQVSREEEQAHYRKLRSQYKKFLEEDRKRQERNERIVRTLERIETRVDTLTSKTERIGQLRRQYKSYLRRISPMKPPESIKAKPAETIATTPYQLQHNIYDDEKQLYDHPSVKKALGKTNDEKIEILDKYLKSLSSQKCNDIQSREKPLDSDQLHHSENGSQRFEEKFTSNHANSIAEDIMNSIYSRHYKKDAADDVKDFDDTVKYRNKYTYPSEVDSDMTRRNLYSNNSDFGDFYSNNKANHHLGLLKQDNEVIQKTEIDGTPLVTLEKGRPKHVEFKDDKLINNTFNSNALTEIDKDVFNKKEEDNKWANHPKNVNPIEKQSAREHLNFEPSINANEHCLNEEFNHNEPATHSTENPPLLSADNIEVSDMKEINKDEEFNTKANITAESTELEQEIPKEKESKSEKINVTLQNNEVVLNHNEITETAVNKEPSNFEKNTDKHSVDNQAEKDGDQKQFDDPQGQLSYHQNSRQIHIEPQKPDEIISPTEPYDKAESESNPDNDKAVVQLQKQNDQPDLEQYDGGDHLNQEYGQDGQSNEQYDQNPQYDEHGQLIQQLDENGQPIQYYNHNVHYDGNGQIVPHQYDANGQTVQQYHENEQPLQSYDHIQDPTSYDVDGGQSVQQQEEDNLSAQQYVESGQSIINQDFDENGQIIQQYDENGQPLIPYDPNLQPQEYDENGQPIQQYDENGQPLQRYDQQYDENGQLVQQYDENGQPYQHYDPNSQQVLYDENGQPITQYDENGQPLQQYEPQYDENGQPIQQYSESGQLYDQTQHYDENGQPIQQYDENGQPIQQYDENGQPLQTYGSEDTVEQQLGQPTQQYDENEQHLQHFDENGQPLQNYGSEDTVKQQAGQHLSGPESNEGGSSNVENLTNNHKDSSESNENPTKTEAMNEPIKQNKVLEMLDTDTESIKQTTSKVSNDSDFDFSNG